MPSATLIVTRPLAAYFRDDPRGYALPELVLENLGFAFDVRDSKRGRKKKVVSLAEEAEKKQILNEKAKLRMRSKRAEAKEALRAAA